MRATIRFLLFACLCWPAFADEPHDQPTAHAADDTSANALPAELKGSTIGRLVDLNGGRIPATLTGWYEAMDGQANLARSIVLFSDAPAHTDFDEARLILAAKGVKDGAKLNLKDRLFVAGIPRLDGSLDFEFISWNDGRQAFDFGIYRGGKLEKADEKACFVCHQTHGPIFRDFPWSNTDSNTTALIPFIRRLGEHYPTEFGELNAKVTQTGQEMSARYKKDFGLPIALGALPIPFRESFHWQGARLVDGAPLLKSAGSEVQEVDNSVRRAGVYLFLNQVREALPKESDKQDFIRRLSLASVLHFMEDSLFSGRDYVDPELRRFLFTDDKAPVKKLPAYYTPILPDFDPLPDINHKSFDEAMEILLKFGDRLREKREKVFPVELLPSRPKAFAANDPAVIGITKLSGQNSPSNGSFLPTVFGFSAGDRQTIVKFGFREPWPTQSAFEFTPEHEKKLRVAFEGPEMKELLSHTDRFPTRPEMMIALLRGLNADSREVRRYEGLKVSSGKLSKSPTTIPPKNPKEGIKEERCLTCHDGAIPGLEMPFSPLALDQWKAALADPKRAQMARRWLKKIGEKLRSGDMPPLDSREKEGFNPKASEWRALRDFIDGI